MAILKVFSVYDSKVGVYETLFTFRTTGEAIRSFSVICTDPKSKFCVHPTDFALFELGTFDDSTAKVDLYPVPKSLGLAQEFKIKESSL